jgi:hypothetical protein
MHSILHDWTDDKAKEILQHLKPAFKKNYTKLLINECVLPPTGAHTLSTGLDLIVMTTLSSGERTQADWERLLGESGFKITKIWTDTNAAYESVIEAEPID